MGSGPLPSNYRPLDGLDGYKPRPPTKPKVKPKPGRPTGPKISPSPSAPAADPVEGDGPNTNDPHVPMT